MFRHKNTIKDVHKCRELSKLVISEGWTTLKIIKDDNLYISHQFNSSYANVLSIDNNLVKIRAHPYLYVLNLINNEILKSFECPDGYGVYAIFSENILISKKNDDDSRDLILLNIKNNSQVWILPNQDVLHLEAFADRIAFSGWRAKNSLTLFDTKLGQKVWKTYFSNKLAIQDPIIYYKDVILLQASNEGTFAIDATSGEILWNSSIEIHSFDSINGHIYCLSNNYVVLDVTTGMEMIRVDNWASKQIAKYPALAFVQSRPYLSEEYLIFSSRTHEDKIEGGVFFIDKNTAEVKEYLRIVFDKDPVQRRDWYGNKIPDDQQIPFLPLEAPIYTNGRLYLVLPSPIEGQKDLYIYEREE